MGSSVVRSLAVAVLRSLLALLGAYLVRWQLVDTGLMQEAAGVLAFMAIDKTWEFYQLHRRELYQRWLLVLGIEADPSTDPAVSREIVSLAKVMTKEGVEP
jgi:hypothetical protein